METKKPDTYVLNVFKWMGYASHCIVPPHSPAGGGLALFWKQDIHVEILSTNQNYIDTAITYKKDKFLATFLYGESDITKRHQFWLALSDLAATRNDAWFITGDFNEILNNTEKS